MEQLRISAKQLGNLAKENFCPRCFYLGYKIHFKYPGAIFAGILSKMDAIQKKSVVKYYEKNGHLPQWLEAEGIIGKPLKSPGPKRFTTTINGIVISGSIDLLLETPTGELIIIDFKTSSPKNGYDPFMPVYEVQLQGYAKIAEDMGLGKVAGIYLVYFSAKTQVEEDNVMDYVGEEQLQVSFDIEVKKLDLKPEETLPPLIEAFKEIITAEEIPEGQPGCSECEKLDMILDLLAPEKADKRMESEEQPLETRGLMVEN